MALLTVATHINEVLVAGRMVVGPFLTDGISVVPLISVVLEKLAKGVPTHRTHAKARLFGIDGHA